MIKDHSPPEEHDYIAAMQAADEFIAPESMEDIEQFPEQPEFSAPIVDQAGNLPICSIDNCRLHLGEVNEIPEWRRLVLDGFHLGFPWLEYQAIVTQVDNDIQQLRDLSNEMTIGGSPSRASSSQGGMCYTGKALMQDLVDLSILNHASAFEMEILGADSSELYFEQWAFGGESDEG